MLIKRNNMATVFDMLIKRNNMATVFNMLIKRNNMATVFICHKEWLQYSICL